MGVAGLAQTDLMELFRRYGYASIIITDNGPPFSRQPFNRLCVMRGIKLMHSYPYSPASKGFAKKGVQIIKRSLDKMLEYGKCNMTKIGVGWKIYSLRCMSTRAEDKASNDY